MSEGVIEMSWQQAGMGTTISENLFFIFERPASIARTLVNSSQGCKVCFYLQAPLICIGSFYWKSDLII